MMSLLLEALAAVAIISLLVIICLGTISLVAMFAKMVIEEWEDRNG